MGVSDSGVSIIRSHWNFAFLPWMRTNVSADVLCGVGTISVAPFWMFNILCRLETRSLSGQAGFFVAHYVSLLLRMIWPCSRCSDRQERNVVQMFTYCSCMLRVRPAVPAWIACGVSVKVSLAELIVGICGGSWPSAHARNNQAVPLR